MGTALAQLLPVALGFALSPVALVEMVLILFSRRALTNGIVFLACIMVPVFGIPFAGAAGQDAARHDQLAAIDRPGNRAAHRRRGPATHRVAQLPGPALAVGAQDLRQDPGH
jgi:hypothetical protein